MTWVRKEDSAALHPKFFRAGVAAYGWHDAASGYCNRNLTDGFVPDRDLDLVFPGTPHETVLELVQVLVREGSLHPVAAGEPVNCPKHSRACPRMTRCERGYVLHDFFDYQPRRSHVLRVRRVRAIAGRKGAEITRKLWEQFAEAKSQQSGKPVGKGGARPPSRPSPTQPKEATTTTEQRQARPPARAPALADEPFLESLRLNPAYAGLDVDREVGKLLAWLDTPRGRGKMLTRQRLVNWLNHADQPMASPNGQPASRRNVNDPWKGRKGGEVTL